MKRKCGNCDALNSISVMVGDKMFVGDIETLQKCINTEIERQRAKAALSAWFEARMVIELINERVQQRGKNENQR